LNVNCIDLFILKNMGAAIIDFRVCPPLVKCQNIMFSGYFIIKLRKHISNCQKTSFH
jgi:hypothetical protein